MKLRPYQVKLKAGVFDAWARGAKVVMMQSPTGSGKTETMKDIVRDLNGPGFIGAHRTELVGQMSRSLVRAGIKHDLMVPKKERDIIVRSHMKTFGHTLYSPDAQWTVGSVDTANARLHKDRWAETVKNVVIDEGHHVLKTNKWGKLFDKLPNFEHGLLASATPGRPDKKGLGSWNDGVCDALVEGPQMRDLINAGYLLDYDVHTIPPTDLKLDGVAISDATGDFNPQQLAEAVKKSQSIVGDVVKTYVNNMMGQPGVTFAVDIEHGERITAAYKAAGVRAVMLHGETPSEERDAAIEALENGGLDQIVNVDLFGEGTDLPNIRCISMARPTASFIVFAQQFGRVLRLLISPFLMDMWDTFDDATRRRLISESAKPRGVVFDHAANVYRHKGPPDAPRVWSLERGTKRAPKPNDGIPLRKCLGCFMAYERIYSCCPSCGLAAPEPDTRDGAIEVDGNIIKLSPELLAAMRGEAQRIDEPATIPHSRPELANVVRKNHQLRQNAQHRLREALALWAGSYPGQTNEVNYKRFYFLFGIDVLAACALSATDAEKLTDRIRAQMAERGIIATV